MITGDTNHLPITAVVLIMVGFFIILSAYLITYLQERIIKRRLKEER